MHLFIALPYNVMIYGDGIIMYGDGVIMYDDGVIMYGDGIVQFVCTVCSHGALSPVSSPGLPSTSPMYLVAILYLSKRKDIPIYF